MLNSNEYRQHLQELVRRTGHEFRDLAILRRALTHCSFANEHQHLGLAHNEALEFLGDSVLNFIISTQLFDRFPGSTEGDLSRMRSRLVSADHLLPLAERLDLGRFLLLGRGEVKTGGTAKKNILCDALESLIAAVYLDGGLEAAKSFVVSLFQESFADREINTPQRKDAKTGLQELTARLRLDMPKYLVVQEEGPPHAKRFSVEVWVEQRKRGEGTGNSKKEAQQLAARAAIASLEAEQEEGTSTPSEPARPSGEGLS